MLSTEEFFALLEREGLGELSFIIKPEGKLISAVNRLFQQFWDSIDEQWLIEAGYVY